MNDILTAGNFTEIARNELNSYLEHNEFAGKWNQRGAEARIESIMHGKDSSKLGRVADNNGGSYQMRSFLSSTTKGAVMAFVKDCEDYFSARGLDPANIKDRVMTNLFGNEWETSAKLDFKSINVGKCKEIVKTFSAEAEALAMTESSKAVAGLMAEPLADNAKNTYAKQYMDMKSKVKFHNYDGYLMHKDFIGDSHRGLMNVGDFNIQKANAELIGSKSDADHSAIHGLAISKLLQLFEDNKIDKKFMPFVSTMTSQAMLMAGASDIASKIAFPELAHSNGKKNVSEALLQDSSVNAYYLQHKRKINVSNNDIAAYRVAMGNDNKIHITNTMGGKCRPTDEKPNKNPDAKDLEAKKYIGKTIRSTIEFVIDPNQQLTVNKDGKVECPKFEVIYRSEVSVTPKETEASKVQ